MPIYKITKVIQYTETLEVEADDVPDAIDKCHVTDGERNNDDYLYDLRVVRISD